MEGDKVK